MSREYEISTCISGSFKFKPEIDLLIEEFQDLHVKVRAPEKGWLVVPRFSIITPSFRPLPSERKMPIRTVEDNFLRSIMDSTFLYVGSFGGYAGGSTNFEMGFALGKEKPVYANQKIINEENDLEYAELLKQIKILSPAEVVKEVEDKIENSLG
jgi:hypothetical protein